MQFQRKAVVLLVCALLSPEAGARQNAPVRDLESGPPIDRALAAGETHAYRLTLAANQYLRVAIDAHAIEQIVVTFAAPDGKTVAEIRRLASGPRTYSLITGEPGEYRLDVRSGDRDAAGRYELRIADRRAATPDDRTSVEAERLFVDAEKLRVSGTGPALRTALTEYEASLALYRLAHDEAGEASAVTDLGRTQDGLGDKQAALVTYDQAIALQHAIGDQSREAYVLNFSALAYDFLGEKQKALEHLERALPLARAAGDGRIEGVTLSNFGVVHYNLGHKEQALDFYNRSLPLAQLAHNGQGESSTLTAIGTLYDSIGEKRTALEYMARALPIRRRVGNQSDEASTLNNMGAVYVTLGEYPDALDVLNQALPHWRAAGDRSGEGATLNNIARAYEAIGEYQRAIDTYTQALQLHRAAGYRFGEANVLTNVGLVYVSLGEPQAALSFFSQALPLHRAASNRTGEAATLGDIGAVYARLNDMAKALDFYGRALPIARAVGDRNGEAAHLAGLARVYLSHRDHDKAGELYRQALALHRAVSNRRGEAATLADLGAVAAAQGDVPRALDLLHQALPIVRAIGDRSGEARVLHQLANAERDAGNLADARADSDAALAIVESVRNKVFNQELRSSYLASVQDYYRLAIDVLARSHAERPSEGFDAAALRVAERARARGLLEILTEADEDIRQEVDPGLLERERTVQQRLNAKAGRRTRLLNGPHTPKQAAEAAADVEAAAAEYRQVEAAIRAGSPRYAALVQPQPLGLADIQRQLDPDTLLLEYALGDDRSYLWAVSPDAIASYDLAPRAEVEATARRFYDFARVDSNAARVQETAAALTRMLIAPVASRLGSKRLVIVADGVLQYIPFAALPDPRSARPLIVDHEMVSLPSASVIAALRRDTAARGPASKEVAVLADPVYTRDDPRVTPAVSAAASRPAGVADRMPVTRDLEMATDDAGIGSGGLARLLNTRREAASILALTPPTKRKRALDFDASRATAMSADLGQYRIVHFATHAILDSVHPELSGIVLSLVDRRGEPQDGFLRLHEIYNLKLPVELIVLSACQTGLGKDIRGEGLIGLTRGFMYAGAPRVVASLWKVDDRATSELMQRFYAGMLGPQRLRPAAALRAAQLTLMKQQTWRAPYYWAAFILQGEWN